MIKIILTIFLISICNLLPAQHIQYREKAKPVPATGSSGGSPIAPNPKSKVIPTTPVTAVKPSESTTATKSRVAINFNSKATNHPTELITDCFLSAIGDRIPNLPLVINDVSPEMVKKLKERYKGRLYSITALNMNDLRLKYKLRICDKDMGKFRVEYLDEAGDIVKDPSLDYE